MGFGLFVPALLTSLMMVAPQAPPSEIVRPEVMGSVESGLLAQGWAALARGDVDQASVYARQLNSLTPRNVHAMMLTVEVDLARAGAMAALNGYETWLGSRKLDHHDVLRRIARGLLFELSRSRDSLTRLEALAALVAEGEPAAQSALMRAATTGSLAEVRLLAAGGHPGAIGRLIEALRGQIGNKIAIVDSLVASGSPQVIAPLTEMLRDPRPEHRAAAAEGLGRLGARDQMTALRTVLTEPSSTLMEQISAAGALLRLGDQSGRPQLAYWLQSEVPGVRLSAAKALADTQDDGWLPAVRGLVRDPDPLVRLDAVKLLAPYDRELAFSNLNPLMSDENPAVREQAVRIYARQLAGDFETLRRLLRSADASTQTIAAARVLELTR